MIAHRLRSWATLSLWLGALVAAVVWLHGLGQALPAPSFGESSDWLARLGPEVAVAAILRLLAMAAGSYLVVVTMLSLLARSLRLPGAVVRLAEAGAPATVRRLTRAAVGVTVVVALTAAPASARSRPTTGSPATPRVVGEAESEEPVVMRRLPDASDADVATDADVARPDDGATHVVQPGDHFWSIAEAALTTRWGRPVGDAEIDPYWRALVAANRSLTPDPDLLLPGQLVTVPPPPAT